MAISEGAVLWRPSQAFKDSSNLARYMRWLSDMGLEFADYEDLWRWSVTDLSAFWRTMWDFFDVRGCRSTEPVITEATMPEAAWFPGTTLNYAENVFRNSASERPAIISQSEETASYAEMTWDELHSQVASVAAALRELGIQCGDRVVAYLPNVPQTVVAFLACASIGATWSSCSPDFGTPSVIDRFKQIEPSVLFACDSYTYGGVVHDRRPIVADLVERLPSLVATVLVPCRSEPLPALPNTLKWHDLLQRSDATLEFESVPFEHPLWVLYTSGTTGIPKAIVHGHGGIVLEHLKGWGFHLDMRPTDRFFWFTTTGWTMWNMVVAGLLHGSTIVLYDGSPGHPDLGALWQLAERARITTFGVSAAYLTSCMKAGLEPRRTYALDDLRVVGSTGSPLSPEGFQWVYDRVGSDVWLVSASGGTDLCAPFVGGCPILPVRAGEIQCRCLGAAVHSFDDAGNELIGEVGELVVTQPMPSMPLFLWNDKDGRRYRESYFELYPGVWRHGDWIRITPAGSVVIYGRSDSTINRYGIRIGTSEIYRSVEGMDEVVDSLAVHVRTDQESSLVLFVSLAGALELTSELSTHITQTIRRDLSPRHVPDRVVQITEVPRTLSGKKLEVPVTRILGGEDPDVCVSRDSMANPQSMDFFVNLVSRSTRPTNWMHDASGSVDIT